MSRQHIEHSPEEPGSGELGTWHTRVLRDLFFIKSLLSREDIVDFLNTEKHRQAEKMSRKRNLFQIKEQEKAVAKHLSKTDITNMPHGKFRAIIIKILTGLEKIV